MEAEDLQEPEALQQIAGELRAYHDSGLRLPTEFDSFRIVRDYAETARERGVEPPPAYEESLADADAIQARLSGPEHEPVPCHNDLLAANFIRGEKTIWIVDWEYAGMGDRYFDLGNFSVNNELDEAGQAALLRGLLRRAARRAPARDAVAVPLHVRLPRGDVGRRCRAASATSTSTSTSTRPSTSTAWPRPRPTPSSRPGSRRPVARKVELPDSARCVIIGGGVGGTSIAYHLAELGWTDVVLLERAQLTSGSTFHSAGLVGPAARLGLADEDDDALGRALSPSRRGVRVRPGLDRVRRHPAGLERGADGGAAPPGRLGEDLRAAAGADLGRGGEGDVPADVHRRACSAAAWLPTDGYLDPAQLTYALADGARDGCQVLQSTRVTGIGVDDGRVRRVETERGDDRVRGRRDRRRHVRRRARASGGGPDPDDPDVAPVPGHPAVPGARPREAPAHPARPRPADLLPRGRRRPGHGGL